MKFTLLCPDLVDNPHGGIPTVTRQALRQIERLAEQSGVSVEFDIWAYHDQPCSVEDVAKASGLRRPPVRFRAFGSNRMAMLSEAVADRGQHDFVFTTHLGVGPMARLLRSPRGKLVQFIHGVECWRRLPVHQRFGLGATDAILSNSQFTLNRFLEFNPEWGHLAASVCWLGLNRDVTVESAVNEETVLPGPSALIVGRMARSERYKGHEELISVWSDVRRFFPTARLDIVGGGDARADVELRAERLGHVRSGAVRFLGRVSYAELQASYRRADVFAMPSCGEGFGLVYLEAMAAGKPCLASTDDAACEVVLGGETGLLVRYGDRPALARALMELFGDAEKRRRLGLAGRARLEKHFTEEQFGRRLYAALAAVEPRLLGSSTPSE